MLLPSEKEEKMENQVWMDFSLHSALLQSYLQSTAPAALFIAGHVNNIRISQLIST